MDDHDDSGGSSGPFTAPSEANRRVRKIVFLFFAIALILYLIWLIVAAIYIFPLCSSCPIEGLWAILWAAAILSVIFLGYFVYIDMLQQSRFMQYRKAYRTLIRVGYGLSIFFAICWIVLLIAYAVVFAPTGLSNSGSATIQGISGQVVIGMGENNILSVQAASDVDVAFGLGWGHAQYRLFQMEIQRRIGQGRLSEIVGSAGLDIDKFMLTTGFFQAALNDVPNISPSVMAIMEAYIAGVNGFIRGNYKHSVGFQLLGFKAEPVFQVADILTYAKLVSYQLSGNWGQELERLQNHVLRNVSGHRLAQLDPMELQTVTTVISDDALGTRYDSFPSSTARSVSLESEVQRLDDYMAVAGAATSSKRASKAGKKAFEIVDEDEQEAQNNDSQDDETYLKDVLSMLNWKQLSKKDKKTLNVFERAKKRFPSFFTPGRGFMKASNNWVVHGNHTTTGKPFLCNDPHLTLSLPSVWMVVSLQSDNISAIGASFPGVPGIPIGRNDHYAWGVTNSGMDVQDLFVMDQVNSTAYRWNGTILAYNTTMESIPVKGSAPVQWQVKRSIYGPIINPIYDGDLGHSVALQWTSLMPNDTTIEAFYGLLGAKSWMDFRTTLSKFVAPAQNFIYADVDGNIGYQLPGPIPVRVDGHTGTYPVPGNGSYDWTRFTDFWTESLWTYNPPEGYIASANNMIATAKYPFNILNDRDWDFSYRAKRITEMITNMISAGIPIDMLHLQAIQQDVTTPFTIDLIGAFAYLKALNSDAQSWIPLLMQWSGQELASSKEALCFESVYTAMTNLGNPETDGAWMNALYWISMLQNQTFPDPICAQDGYDCGVTIGKTFNQALIDRKIGPSNTRKTWGTLHHAVLTHQIFGDTPIACLFNRKESTGGSHYTVNAADYDGDTFNTIVGPSYRQVFDLHDLHNSKYILPGGPAEQITSELYNPGFSDWVQGIYWPYNIDNAYARAKYILNPA